MSGVYVHGYSAAEAMRLNSQASILVEFIHRGVCFPAGSRILEAGCGTGAQTIELVRQHPECELIAIDRFAESLAIAEERVRSQAQLANTRFADVRFRVADLNALPFGAAEFDGAFLCFVLEHLPDVARALSEIKRVLKPGAKLHAFEGDHGSVTAWPNDPAIYRLVAAVAGYQSEQGGDACIGRRLCPVLLSAGFHQVTVRPYVAYSDAVRPEWREAFTKATFTDMMALQRDAVLARALLTETEWQEGMEALQQAALGDGTFSYTFFRASALR